MGKITLNKDFLDWDYYNDPLTMRLFIHLCINTTEKEYSFRGHRIGLGSLVTSKHKLSLELGTSPDCISNGFWKLYRTGIIEYKNLGEAFTDPNADIEGPKIYREAVIISILNQLSEEDYPYLKEESL